MIIDVVAAIIINDNRILITRRPDSCRHSGLWEFPGGKVDNGESHRQALKRELEEELGIIANVGDYFMQSRSVVDNSTIRLYTYFVYDYEKEIDIKFHSDYKWVCAENLSNYSYPDADIPVVIRLANCNDEENG